MTWARAWPSGWPRRGTERQHRQPHLVHGRGAGRPASAGRAVRLADVPGALAEVDLLLTSTGAAAPLLELGDVERVHRRPAHGRPLLIVDIAVPRDVDPTAGAPRPA